jgi:hypothetical protein
MTVITSMAAASVQRAKLATKIAAHLVLSTLKEVDADQVPVPEGTIYAGLLAHGCTLPQYQDLMGSLERVGMVSREGHQAMLRPKGKDAVDRLASEIADLKAKLGIGSAQRAGA